MKIKQREESVLSHFAWSKKLFCTLHFMFYFIVKEDVTFQVILALLEQVRLGWQLWTPCVWMHVGESICGSFPFVSASLSWPQNRHCAELWCGQWMLGPPLEGILGCLSCRSWDWAVGVLCLMAWGPLKKVTCHNHVRGSCASPFPCWRFPIRAGSIWDLSCCAGRELGMAGLHKVPSGAALAGSWALLNEGTSARWPQTASFLC